MGKIKELTQEFELIQKELIKHKYYYYVKSEPIISDYDYDMLEVKSRKLAKELGFRADKWEGPENNESEHVHWMVDFKEDHPLAMQFLEEIGEK